MGASAQIFATFEARILALAGAACLLTGVLLQIPAMVGWGSAMVGALALARAFARVALADVRSAGLEMSWHSADRVWKMRRGGDLSVMLELRNRSSRRVCFTGARALASGLEVTVSPVEGEIAPGGTHALTLHVRGPRVGRHGLHGISLEAQPGNALFEVPLTFSSPVGVEVLPGGLSHSSRDARGGRARLLSDADKPTRLPGSSAQIRELREHVPGDPYKRIAWKATARRGKLMVKELEQDEREVVWVLLDSAVELLAGEPGGAPLDLAIEQVAGLLHQHLGCGDRVGLSIFASRISHFFLPDRGPLHKNKLTLALMASTSCLDDDRSDLDESDVALRVLEHLVSLDPAVGREKKPVEVRTVLAYASANMKRAPFTPSVPHAKSERDALLRHYLSSFGLSYAPRAEGEQVLAQVHLTSLLRQIAVMKRPKPTRVYVVAPVPEKASSALTSQLARLRARGIQVQWVMMLPPGTLSLGSNSKERVVAESAHLRASSTAERWRRQLLSMRVRPVRSGRERRSSST